YRGDAGSLFNRFIAHAGGGSPMTVHGTVGQTRAFIHTRYMGRCIELALENPPAKGDRVKIINQMTETHRVRDLAELIAEISDAEVAYVPNPRKESDRKSVV